MSPGVAFVGSHPLAGSEKHGPDWSDADLFEGRLVVMTPDAPSAECGVPSAESTVHSVLRTSHSALEQVAAFWHALGTRVRMMDPEEHDRAVALTSHLPHLTASALAATVPAALLDLTATGFRDSTRLAAGSPNVWTAIFHANRDAVLAALDAYRDRLDQFRRAREWRPRLDRAAAERGASAARGAVGSLTVTARSFATASVPVRDLHRAWSSRSCTAFSVSVIAAPARYFSR